MKFFNASKIAIVAMIAMALVATFTIQASAEAVLLETTIQQMVVKPDKNGNDFVRFIITEPRTLNGISYDAELVATAFGPEKVAQAQANYKPGDKLKAIASQSEYQGRTYYNIVQFVN
jgi:hypothetical protein